MQRMHTAESKVRILLHRRPTWDTDRLRVTMAVGAGIALIVVAVMGYSGFFGYSPLPVAFILVVYFVLLGPRLGKRKTHVTVISPPARSCSSC
ncbi:MAG: hypothetical protein PVSMB7_22970 [Chloroflexota bacterium]